MRRLYLIRHAKSDWSKEYFDDFDRGLSKRGRNDLKLMAAYLAEKNIKPDIILSSPALRTRLTAEKLSKKTKYNKDIKYLDKLYMADPEIILDILSEQKDKNKSIFLVNHNPALTELANMLTDKNIDNIPTLGIAVIEFDIKNWKEIKNITGKMNLFICPRELKKQI